MQIKTVTSDALEYSRLLSDRLNQYSKRLKEYMGVSLFGYGKLFYDGTCTYSSNNLQFAQSIIEYQSKHATVIFYQSILNNKEDMYAISWPESPTHPLMDYYRSLGYWNGMSVIRFQRDGTEVFFFAADLHNITIHDFYIKGHKDFIKFSKCFSDENNDLLQNRYISRLPLVGNSRPNLEHEVKSQFKQEQLKTRKFFDSILEPSVNLSKQEYRCIEILAQGRTSKEIAQILNLSPRTVQSYIDSVKDKTGCNFKSQILDLFFDDRLTTNIIL